MVGGEWWVLYFYTMRGKFFVFGNIGDGRACVDLANHNFASVCLGGCESASRPISNRCCYELSESVESSAPALASTFDVDIYFHGYVKDAIGIKTLHMWKITGCPFFYTCQDAELHLLHFNSDTDIQDIEMGNSDDTDDTEDIEDIEDVSDASGNDNDIVLADSGALAVTNTNGTDDATLVRNMIQANQAYTESIKNRKAWIGMNLGEECINMSFSKWTNMSKKELKVRKGNTAFVLSESFLAAEYTTPCTFFSKHMFIYDEFSREEWVNKNTTLVFNTEGPNGRFFVDFKKGCHTLMLIPDKVEYMHGIFFQKTRLVYLKKNQPLSQTFGFIFPPNSRSLVGLRKKHISKHTECLDMVAISALFPRIRETFEYITEMQAVWLIGLYHMWTNNAILPDTYRPILLKGGNAVRNTTDVLVVMNDSPNWMGIMPQTCLDKFNRSRYCAINAPPCMGKTYFVTHLAASVHHSVKVLFVCKDSAYPDVQWIASENPNVHIYPFRKDNGKVREANAEVNAEVGAGETYDMVIVDDVEAVLNIVISKWDVCYTPFMNCVLSADMFVGIGSVSHELSRKLFIMSTCTEYAQLRDATSSWNIPRSVPPAFLFPGHHDKQFVPMLDTMRMRDQNLPYITKGAGLGIDVRRDVHIIPRKAVKKQAFGSLLLNDTFIATTTTSKITPSFVEKHSYLVDFMNALFFSTKPQPINTALIKINADLDTFNIAGTKRFREMETVAETSHDLHMETVRFLGEHEGGIHKFECPVCFKVLDTTEEADRQAKIAIYMACKHAFCEECNTRMHTNKCPHCRTYTFNKCVVSIDDMEKGTAFQKEVYAFIGNNMAILEGVSARVADIAGIIGTHMENCGARLALIVLPKVALTPFVKQVLQHKLKSQTKTSGVEIVHINDMTDPLIHPPKPLKRSSWVCVLASLQDLCGRDVQCFDHVFTPCVFTRKEAALLHSRVTKYRGEGTKEKKSVHIYNIFGGW